MLVIIFFVFGYLFIIFEDYFSLNKVIPSLLMATICWSLIMFFNIPVYELNHNLIKVRDNHHLLLVHLGKASEIVFFLLGAMLIISILEKSSAFDAMSELLYTDTKRKFLWKISIISFLLSALIDNLTATVVLISLLKKTIHNYKERLYYLGLSIISANAGGVWSPIGDITTTMLWISKKVTTFCLLKKIFFPSIICMLISTQIISYMSIFNGEMKWKKTPLSKKNLKIGLYMLLIGLILMFFVPIYKTIIGVPPYIGMMFSLGIMLTIYSVLYEKKILLFSSKNILKKVDVTSILFFFGILLSISSLEGIGILYKMSQWINHIVYNWEITTILLGFISSIVDNVPLVAATISMFSHPIDHSFWHFIAYVSGTGGSLLIIGSASGVAAMSIEKIDFFWYLKKISWIAFIGYISGFICLLFIEKIN
ncbi:sodium:proton antiporter NhaD [Blattabacterium cuenoti]|uniref:sodium:proton antiporter NhaD n=1 Tax=Blattabacterium cuenoti TaxID=1653831 RepID=UPI00163BA71E|nr:sodium:proton antiporter NhaD [Blattabacterium cuenoti]